MSQRFDRAMGGSSALLMAAISAVLSTDQARPPRRRVGGAVPTGRPGQPRPSGAKLARMAAEGRLGVSNP